MGAWKYGALTFLESPRPCILHAFKRTGKKAETRRKEIQEQACSSEDKECATAKRNIFLLAAPSAQYVRQIMAERRIGAQQRGASQAASGLDRPVGCARLVKRSWRQSPASLILAAHKACLHHPTRSRSSSDAVSTMSPLPSPKLSRSPSPRLVSAADSADSSQQYKCQWADCTKALSDPEALYNHLCNDHIGRKSTNNLCLTCKWKDCGTSCAKRDHITSHLRGMSARLLSRHTC